MYIGYTLSTRVINIFFILSYEACNVWTRVEYQVNSKKIVIYNFQILCALISVLSDIIKSFLVQLEWQFASFVTAMECVNFETSFVFDNANFVVK